MTSTTRALYNGDCPICDAEMCRYQEIAEAEGLPLAFDDLNSCALERWGVTEDAATRLLHVEHEGRLYIGFEAMVILWAQIPHMRGMARLSRLPGLFHLLSFGYTHIVARWIYHRHLRRKARGLIPRR